MNREPAIACRGVRRAALCALTGALTVVPVASAGVPSPAPSFRVTSTLDGRTVLPHKIHWLGKPSLPTRKVAEVAFLIDGRVAWIEHKAPYTFSDDGGYLVTSWLRSGPHRFTVRVRSTDGRTMGDTVRADVAPAKSPPPALAGRWRRDLAATAHDPGGGADAPAGRWTLVFDRKWVQDRAPGAWDPVRSASTGLGAIVDNEWVPGTGRFELGGGVITRIVHDSDAEGGWWCDPGGPSATYAWSVRGDTLTLSPLGGSDPCTLRGKVYTGQWNRVR